MKVFAFALFCALSSGVAMAQNGWEYYAEGSGISEVPFSGSVIYGVGCTVPGPYNWSASENCNRKVWGAITQEPNWSTRFKFLVNQEWREVGFGTEQLQSGDMLSVKKDGWNAFGTETFVRGNEFAGRYLPEYVVSSIYAVVVPLGSGGSGGGM
jgi:hypothetical protein